VLTLRYSLMVPVSLIGLYATGGHRELPTLTILRTFATVALPALRTLGSLTPYVTTPYGGPRRIETGRWPPDASPEATDARRAVRQPGRLRPARVTATSRRTPPSDGRSPAAARACRQ
jgi:hypothetical protein